MLAVGRVVMTDLKGLAFLGLALPVKIPGAKGILIEQCAEQARLIRAGP